MTGRVRAFLVGAALNALAMKSGDLGVVYVFVLGLEDVLALNGACAARKRSICGRRPHI
jgi:hypothetical protein